MPSAYNHFDKPSPTNHHASINKVMYIEINQLDHAWQGAIA